MNTGTNKIFTAEMLRSFSETCLQSVGTHKADSVIIADNMVQANLRGEDSHGVQLLPIWVKRINHGGIKTNTTMELVEDHPSTALLNANDGIGQVAAVQAMRLAVKKATQTGFALVGVQHISSYTNAKHSTMIALDHKMIGFSMSNANPILFAPGGITHRIGTNPIAFAVPAKHEFPVVLDMSTAVVGHERIREAVRQNIPIPSEWGVDKAGNPTNDPNDIWEGGSLNHFGGYKGFGLAVIIEALTGVLMDAGFTTGVSEWFPYENIEDRGKLFGALNIEHFINYDTFTSRVDTLIREVRASKLAPGFERIYLPGEKGFLESNKRTSQGIPLDVRMVEQLEALALELNVSKLNSLNSTE